MTESERLVLAEIGRPNGGSMRTPQDVAGQLNVTKGTQLTWQGVAATARRLRQRGYITIHSHRITWYEITDAGRQELGQPVVLVIDEAAEVLKAADPGAFRDIAREGRKTTTDTPRETT